LPLKSVYDSERYNAQSRTPTSILGPKNVEAITENDDQLREANFYLYYRPVEGLPWFLAWVFGRPISHWSVVTEFPTCEPPRVFTFEAGAEQSQGSKIIATRSMEYPPPNDNLKRIELGAKCVSPRQLLEYAQKVSLNGKPYNLIIRNCQAWCKKFCSFISNDFLEEQFWDAKNFVVAAAVAGAAVFSAISPGTSAILASKISLVEIEIEKERRSMQMKQAQSASVADLADFPLD
jgi:hypothetical protein